jgi:hypothetical protein
LLIYRLGIYAPQPQRIVYYREGGVSNLGGFLGVFQVEGMPKPSGKGSRPAWTFAYLADPFPEGSRPKTEIHPGFLGIRVGDW